MKNKRNIYFLLPAVLIIWGILIFKIINGLNPTIDNTRNNEITGQFTPKSLKKSETFTIKTDYRDPFLGTLKQKKSTKAKPKNSQVVKKERLPFPDIVFKGIVSPKGNNENVFFIIVNGQQHLYKNNTEHDGVKLLKGNSQKITLQFQGQQQTFQIEK